MPKGGARARSGPTRKPTEVKLLEGTFAKYRDAQRPVLDASAFPQPPAYLNARQLELWRELEQHCGVWIGTSDRLALLGAVSVYDLIRRNFEAQAATPDASAMLTSKVFMDDSGGGTVEAKENPLINQQLKLWRELRGFIAILGLSPADRARVHVKEPHGQAASKWAGVLKNAR
jgi:phage terminase small subunit